MKTIKEKFIELDEKGEKALLASLMVGDPALDTSVELAVAMAQSGVDILVLEIPFADATVGGAVIQNAIKRALVQPIDMGNVFSTVGTIRQYTDIPIVLSVYYNPVFAFGEEKFCAQAAAAGACGVFVIDLPFGERSAIAGYAPQTFPKIEAFAPTTPQNRLQQIVASAQGFLHFIPQGKEVQNIVENIQRVKECASLPVCVDMAGRDREEIKAIAANCDGIMVSTDFIASIAENLTQKDLVVRLGRVAADYKQLIRR